MGTAPPHLRSRVLGEKQPQMQECTQTPTTAKDRHLGDLCALEAEQEGLVLPRMCSLGQGTGMTKIPTLIGVEGSGAP